MQPFNGILLIDKPTGISSFGVVARVRRNLSQLAGKKIKVGHTGTLDPFASGLMIIVVGEYCKRASEFSKLDKAYTATLVLGKTSSTGDPEGEIIEVADRRPTRDELEEALVPLRGEIQQTPPAFSAIKINGQRAYKLAREGKTVEMPSRTVTVHALTLDSYNYPEAVISCHVSSGTYIRTLVQDVGGALGTGAYTKALRRTRISTWDVSNAVTLEESDFSQMLQVL